MSSPSRVITATAASSRSARAVVAGTGPTPVISQRSPDLVCPRASAALSTVTRTSTGLHGPSPARATSASAAYAERGSRRPARRASQKIRSVCAFHAELNRAPASGASRASSRYAPSGSVHSCARRSTCKRRAQAWSSASAPARTSRHRSRSPLTLVEPAASRSSASACGSAAAAPATSAACTSDRSPARNAASVSGIASSARAISSVREAAPTVSPVAAATQCAALRCPLSRHTLVSSTRRARRDLIAVHRRSARAASSNTVAACRPSSATGFSCREICSSSPSTCANTLPPRGGHRPGKLRVPYRTYVRLSSVEHAAPAVGVELGSQRVHVSCGQPLVRTVLLAAYPHGIARLPASRAQRLLVDLVVRGQGHVFDDPHVVRRPLRPEVGLGGEEAGERIRVELHARPEFQCGHHLVTRPSIRNRIHRHHHHTGQPRQDPLDRRGGEVLAVDAQSVGAAPREVQPPVGVPVREVAAPVPTVTHPFARRLLVVVVALEPGAGVPAHELADRLVAVHEPTVLVEDRGRGLLARVRVHDDDIRALTRPRLPERLLGAAG